MPLGEVTIYLGERCWRQVGGGFEELVVPHPPPRVIESEGASNLRDEGIDASGFLDWARDYPGWWATQSCGPLGGPVEPSVSVFGFIYILKKYILLYLHDFDRVCLCLDRLLPPNHPLRGRHLPLGEGGG